MSLYKSRDQFSWQTRQTGPPPPNVYPLPEPTDGARSLPTEGSSYQVLFHRNGVLQPPPASMEKFASSLFEYLSKNTDINLNVGFSAILQRDARNIPQAVIRKDVADALPGAPIHLGNFDEATTKATLIRTDAIPGDNGTNELIFVHYRMPAMPEQFAFWQSTGADSPAPPFLTSLDEKTHCSVILWHTHAHRDTSKNPFGVLEGHGLDFTLLQPAGSEVLRSLGGRPVYVRDPSLQSCCKFCRKVGHARPDCPTAPECYNCGSTQHARDRCPRAPKKRAPAPAPTLAKSVIPANLPRLGSSASRSSSTPVVPAATRPVQHQLPTTPTRASTPHPQRATGSPSKRRRNSSPSSSPPHVNQTSSTAQEQPQEPAHEQEASSPSAEDHSGSSASNSSMDTEVDDDTFTMEQLAQGSLPLRRSQRLQSSSKLSLEEPFETPASSFSAQPPTEVSSQTGEHSPSSQRSSIGATAAAAMKNLLRQ